MGQAKIFWIDEAAIRERLRENHSHLVDGAASGNSSNPATDFAKPDDNEQLFKPIGNALYQLSQQEYSSKFSLPFNDYENVFNYTTMLHSSWDNILIWTGNQLIPLGADNYKYDQVKVFIELEKYSDEKCFGFALPQPTREMIIAKQKKWETVCANKGDFSIWFVYDDYKRHHNPSKDDIKLGQEFLNLMLCNWSDFSQDVGLKKVCSIIKPQFGFFAWGGNTMWKLSGVDHDKLLEFLKHEDEK